MREGSSRPGDPPHRGDSVSGRTRRAMHPFAPARGLIPDQCGPVKETDLTSRQGDAGRICAFDMQPAALEARRLGDEGSGRALHRLDLRTAAPRMAEALAARARMFPPPGGASTPSLAHENLCGRSAQFRHHRSVRARRADDRRGLPRPCRAVPRSRALSGRCRRDGQSQRPQGGWCRGGDRCRWRLHPLSPALRPTSIRSNRCSPS